MIISNDILLDENGDISIRNGDIEVGDVEQQNQELLFEFNKGSLLEYPLVGIAINMYQNSIINKHELEREIRIQLESDGYSVKNIKIIPDVEKNDGFLIDFEAVRIK